jgi:hypothetical protein
MNRRGIPRRNRSWHLAVGSQLIRPRLTVDMRGIRDLVMEICGALHNFRVRLGHWQPMI